MNMNNNNQNKISMYELEEIKLLLDLQCNEKNFFLTEELSTKQEKKSNNFKKNPVKKTMKK